MRRHTRSDDAILHIGWAREAEQRGDFLAARVEYMSCVESWKQAGNSDELAEAAKEYEAFVRRDPVFEGLVEKLVPIIKANPGILQSDITKQVESIDWSALRRYGRPVAKEDIYYALYFSDKFGRITRVKKGRSYELRLAI